jgi:hypothetical protein
MLDSAVITMLDMPRNSVRDFVNVGARHPLTTRHECWAVAEQFIHVFEVETFRLWLEAPKEYGIGEVADYEDEIEFLARVLVYSRVSRRHRYSPSR